MAKIITAQQLQDAGACFYSVEDFRRIFGESAEVTPENAIRALETIGGIPSFVGTKLLTGEAVAKWQERCADLRHAPVASANDCPACRGMMLIFVELYNEESGDAQQDT